MIRRVYALVAALMLAVGFVMFVPAMAQAAYDPFAPACNNLGGEGTGSSAVCQTKATQNPLTGPKGTIVKVTGILSIVTAIVAVIYMVWGGITYINSNGDSSAVSSAKSTLIYALVGLVVALLARPLINFVIGRI